MPSFLHGFVPACCRGALESGRLRRVRDPLESPQGRGKDGMDSLVYVDRNEVLQLSNLNSEPPALLARLPGGQTPIASP